MATWAAGRAVKRLSESVLPDLARLVSTSKVRRLRLVALRAGASQSHCGNHWDEAAKMMALPTREVGDGDAASAPCSIGVSEQGAAPVGPDASRLAALDVASSRCAPGPS